MRVVLARHMGMCFGVRDALLMAESIPDASRVTIHGELVHNEEILVRLRQRGFHQTAEQAREALPATDRVLVTAHGVSGREADRLRAAGKTLIDTTCPLVAKVHDAANVMRRDGRFVVVIGQRRHVEVLGITGDLDAFAVASCLDDVRCWDAPRIGVVCQTTAAPDEVGAIHRRIVALNPHSDIRFEDTVCRPTRLRQLSVEILLRQVDALVVVGGRNSNNTRKLAARAAAHGRPCALVQTAEDIDPTWCRQFEAIGLTAGTSTLDRTVDSVYQALLTIAPQETLHASLDRPEAIST